MNPTADPTADGSRPVLIYDGDCGFCVYWARYWQKLTGSRVRFGPYQDLAAHYPHVPLAEFRRASQYIAADGRRAAAAEASFLTLSHAPGKQFWLTLYRSLPGFAALAELVYAFIARHRPAGYRISLLLWGRDYAPPRYELGAFLFLRGLGLVYLAAFVSFGVQARGLIGSHGILPLGEFADAVRAAVGAERFYLVPMVFWWSASDFAIQTVCWGGAGLALLLTCNLLPRVSLLLLYILYLSLLYAGQVFMTYPVGRLPAGGRIPRASDELRHHARAVWLLRWLLFRFMFMSGVVKLLSGDPNWWNLSALSYHFVTQPLPTPLAWYAAHLPAGAAALRHRRHVRHRAGSAVPDLLPAPPALPRGRRHPAAPEPDSAYRQLQLVQPADHAAVPAAVRRRGAPPDLAGAPARAVVVAARPAGHVALRRCSSPHSLRSSCSAAWCRWMRGSAAARRRTRSWSRAQLNRCTS